MLEPERLFLEVRSSRRLMLMLLGVYLLTLISIAMFYTNGILYLALILFVVITGGFVQALKKMTWLRQVSISSSDECLIVTDNGKTYEASLLRGCYCSDWVIILSFSIPEMSKILHTVVLNDSVNTSLWKQLRVFLKTSAFHAGETR